MLRELIRSQLPFFEKMRYKNGFEDTEVVEYFSKKELPQAKFAKGICELFRCKGYLNLVSIRPDGLYFKNEPIGQSLIHEGAKSTPPQTINISNVNFKAESYRYNNDECLNRYKAALDEMINKGNILSLTDFPCDHELVEYIHSKGYNVFTHAIIQKTNGKGVCNLFACPKGMGVPKNIYVLPDKYGLTHHEHSRPQQLELPDEIACHGDTYFEFGNPDFIIGICYNSSLRSSDQRLELAKNQMIKISSFNEKPIYIGGDFLNFGLNQKVNRLCSLEELNALNAVFPVFLPAILSLISVNIFGMSLLDGQKLADNLTPFRNSMLESKYLRLLYNHHGLDYLTPSVNMVRKGPKILRGLFEVCTQNLVTNRPVEIVTRKLPKTDDFFEHFTRTNINSSKVSVYSGKKESDIKREREMAKWIQPLAISAVVALIALISFFKF